jgi:hypothetical protein
MYQARHVLRQLPYLLTWSGKGVNFRVLQARSACNTLKFTFFHDQGEQLSITVSFNGGSKMKRFVFPSSLFLLFSLLLSSCLPSPVSAAQATPNASTLEAGVVQTVESDFAQQTAAAPTSTPTETPTETPTSTPTPAATPTNTPTTPAPIVQVTPCYRAAFIEDVTVADGSQFSAGSDFTKTWRLQNTGSCTWTTDFQVVFDHGDQMGAPSSFNLPYTVFPGQTVDLSTDMTAPDSAGTYEGFWRLETPNGGTIFGDFTDQIVVTNSVGSIDIRSIDVNVDDSRVTLTCPPGNKFTVTATIRINGSGEVKYYWEFSNDTRSDEHTLTFDGSTRRTVSTTFRADHSGTFWARIHVVSPDSMNSERVFFSLTCLRPTPKNTRTPAPTLTSTPTPRDTRIPRNTPTPRNTRSSSRDSLLPLFTPTLTPGP